MSFESGAVTYREFYLPQRVTQDIWEAFRAHVPPPMESLTHGEARGWVTGRHLLDRNLTQETAFMAGYLRLSLMKAERKIPPALLKVECRMEELAHLQASGSAFLKRSEKIEIKQTVVERLQPTMPLTLTGIDMTLDIQNERLYAAATSDKQLDAFVLSFQEATGMMPIPVTPQAAAMRRKHCNARDLAPSAFVPDATAEDSGEDTLGRDFLTWVWHYMEMRGGTMALDNGMPFGVGLEGPLVLAGESSGSFETVLRKGMPLAGPETRTALLAGKKLRAARVLLGREDQTWAVSLDADQFVFRGMKLPKSEEQMGPISRFQERMISLQVFHDCWFGLFDRFLDERFDPKRWAATVRDIAQWIQTRRVAG